MEILVLGLCRTGTMSMKIALEDLGYKNVYHFTSVFEHESHATEWIKLIQDKYEHPGEKLEEIMKAELGAILREYQAVTDIPTACFARELIATYPSAKIILTTRSAETWHKSMLRTIDALQSSYLNRLGLLFTNQHLKSLSDLMDLIIKHYFHGSILVNGVKVFEEHEMMVKDICRREKRECLEFKLGDGWEPLCRFLGKPVPNAHFPHVNDSESWRRSFGLGWGELNMVLYGLLGILLLVGVWVSMRVV